MGRLIAGRLFYIAAAVWLAASIGFVVMRLAPGDATSELITEGAQSATIAAERARLGLDRSAASAYASWLGAALRFDLGVSTRFGRPVGALVVERAINTAVIAVGAFALALCIGIALGSIAAARPGPIGHVIAAWSVAALSLPPFVLSLILAWLAVSNGWPPVGGWAGGDMAARWSSLARLIVPVAALALPLTAVIERIQARAMESALGEPGLAAARARGIGRHRLVWRHAFRLALPAVISVAGLLAGHLLSGSLAVEMVTSWPGLGRLTYDALIARDVSLVAGCAGAAAGLAACAALVSDVVLATIDPRARNETGLALRQANVIPSTERA